ncbi:hypothetical protein [Devosia sp.]|uniref:hypothetical protein n=1 Tax=Devosia sp. TaxID=1871048 RepID=UPI002FC89095
MSFREKTAWIAVLTTLVVWSVYFAWFWADVAGQQLDGGTVLTRFLICMGISLVVMVGLNVATGVMTAKNIETPPDELERQIEARADRIGFKLLELLVPVGLIGGLLATDMIRSAFPADPAGSVALIFANGILMAFVLTEVVREAVHIASFRMTA